MNHRLHSILTALLLIFALTALARAQSAEADCPTTGPAFTIQGFGAGTTGGCQPGRNVYTVTNLNDSGTGSLRAALALPGPRLIKFSVSGDITITSPLDVQSNTTINGIDAPNGGIAIKGHGVRVTEANVILRHIRVRPGTTYPAPSNVDGIGIQNNNVVLDHCSISWAVDENIGAPYGSNRTIQYSIISEGLFNSTGQEQPHSMGILVGDGSMTMHHNLFAHNNDRNPALQNNGYVEFINNIVYNAGGLWGSMAPYNAAFTLRVDAVKNYAKQGPNFCCTANSDMAGTWQTGGTTVGSNHFLYLRGNIDTWRRTSDAHPQSYSLRLQSLDGLIWQYYNNAGGENGVRQNSNPTVTEEPAANLTSTLLSNVGATKPCRDSVDTRVVSSVTAGTGNFIDNPSQVGGYPNLTTACGGGGGGNPAPTVSGISPTSGSTAGGTSVTITGTGFLAGASVTLGGTSATSVNIVSSTSITATSPAHAAGAVNVVVTNTDAQSGTLTNGFTYTTPGSPAPTVSSISPTSGTTLGGTSITITGTGFLSGATVSLGAAAATSVVVVNSTSITASAGAHAAGVVNVVVTNTDVQSGTLANGYTYASASCSTCIGKAVFTPSNSCTMESESGTIGAPMVIQSDPFASGGQYVSSPTANSGTVTFTINVLVAGNYIFWARVLAPAANQDSLFVSIDGSNETVFFANTFSSYWQWATVGAGDARIFNLSQGTHTLTFRGREVNTGLDTIGIAEDPACPRPEPTSTPRVTTSGNVIFSGTVKSNE